MTNSAEHIATPEERVARAMFDAREVRRMSNPHIASAKWEDHRDYYVENARAAIEAMSTPSTAVTEEKPFAYAYRYPTFPPAGATVIRLGTNGREINGSKPIETIPLYTRSATPSPDRTVVERAYREGYAQGMVAGSLVNLDEDWEASKTLSAMPEASDLERKCAETEGARK